ncbi:MAG: S24 family peptidase [Achromobacter sp.]|uniref:S24 family peptidase n=1 Tax=Achromobacter sp. TaxID=134375 RepID=UPI003D060ECE
MSKPTLNDILATNLASLMEKAGHTQASLAKLSGIGQTTISLYLNPSRRQPSKSGKVPSAKFGEVEALAAVYGVDPWDLLRPAGEASSTGRPVVKRGSLTDMHSASDEFPMRGSSDATSDSYQPGFGGNPPRLSRVPNIGHVARAGYSANDQEFMPIPELDVRLAAGHLGIENYEETEIGEILFRRSFLESLKLPIERMKVVYADGDSMEPIIRNKGPMLFFEDPVTDVRKIDPRTVYAINLGGKMVVKCIQRDHDGTLLAKSLNPAHPPFPLKLDNGQDVRIVGRILWSPYDLRNGVDERLL